MRKFYSLLIAVILGLNLFNANAENTDENLTYVDPRVADVVLKKYFGNMESDYSEYFTPKYDNETMLKNVMDAYIGMLSYNEGLVSILGVYGVCNVAFNQLNIKPEHPLDANQYNAFKVNTCTDFAYDLSTQEPEHKECPYVISKVDDTQSKILYLKKGSASGFIRNKGSLTWRFLNPGALRGSDYDCETLKVYQKDKDGNKVTGKFAVFQSEQVGKDAVRWLLLHGKSYKGKTARQAIYKYAPSTDNNSPDTYVQRLIDQGVDVDKLLTVLTYDEMSHLIDAIREVEAWNPGTVDEF